MKANNKQHISICWNKAIFSERHGTLAEFYMMWKLSVTSFPTPTTSD